MLEPWRWEPLDNLFERVPVRLDSPGPLLAPAHAMTVRRDERRGLHLTLFLDDGAAGGAEPPPPGTVRRADDRAEFTSPNGFSGVIDGVIVRAKKRTTDATQGVTSRTQDATCTSIAVEVAGAGPPKHTIEWIDNFQADSFQWFGSVVEETTDQRTITFGHGEEAIRLSATGDGISSCSQSVGLSVGGWQLYLATAARPHPGGVRAPGYIVYRGVPDETVRQKIRDCLSFALGHHFVYLGSAVLDEADALRSFLLVDGNLIGERVFELPPMPPAPLGTQSQREVDPQILSRVVSGLHGKADTLNFRSLSWQYWHAAAAPSHVAAAQFGAAVEALRDAYKEAHAAKFRARIIADKTKWKALHAKLLAAVDESALDEGAAALIKSKLPNLNAMPSSLVSEQVFDVLKLELSATEQGAWKSRNAAAHGSSVKGDAVETIRNAKLLRILFHRLLLRTTEGSDAYRDYYTVGHPVRTLEKPVL